MRTDESASLRVLLIGIMLIVATVGCVVFLVATGVLRLTGTHAMGAGVALLLVALLAAAMAILIDVMPAKNSSTCIISQALPEN